MTDPYKAGLEHIRAGRFFEAHEELEIVWRAAAPEERDFYQGLVHVAVAWYQAGRGRPVATARQLEKALRRLEAYEPTHRGVDVAALRRQLTELRETMDLRGCQPDGIEGAIDRDVKPPVAVEEEQ
jgi:predicted metal-dependent hydrolase